MINDITSDPDGNLYISDTDANRIYKFSNGTLTVWLEEGLSTPNGLLFDGNRLLVALQGSKDLSSIDLASKQKTVITGDLNRGDGIAWTGIQGYYLVTDWEGELLMVNPDSSKVSLLNTKAEKGNCADLAYIPEEKLLILPTFYKHHVICYRLNELNQ
jgi:sugar lactone lactonase YvrE